MLSFKSAFRGAAVAALFLALFIAGCGEAEMNEEQALKYDWDQAVKENTVASYTRFREKHPESDFARQAMVNLNAILKKRREDWKKASEENTVQAYQAFIDKHDDVPNAYLGQAEDRIDELRWEKTKADKSIESYQSFLENHPDSAYADLARASLKNMRVIEDFEKDRDAREKERAFEEKMREEEQRLIDDERERREMIKARRKKEELRNMARSAKTFLFDEMESRMDSIPPSEITPDDLADQNFWLEAETASAKITRDAGDVRVAEFVYRGLGSQSNVEKTVRATFKKYRNFWDPAEASVVRERELNEE